MMNRKLKKVISTWVEAGGGDREEIVKDLGCIDFISFLTLVVDS